MKAESPLPCHLKENAVLQKYASNTSIFVKYIKNISPKHTFINCANFTKHISKHYKISTFFLGPSQVSSKKFQKTTAKGKKPLKIQFEYKQKVQKLKILP